MGTAVSAFTTGNYPCQPVVVYLFEKSVNLLFTLDLKLTSLKTSVLIKCLIRSQLLKY